MKIQRLFTTADKPVADQIEWKKVPAKITDAEGKTLFDFNEVEVPAQWSERATNILAHKYLRKAGVPQGALDGVETSSMPSWLWPRKADPGIATGAETSARQVFHRLAGCWTYWGWRGGYFKLPMDDGLSNPNPYRETESENAHAFYDEIYYMLAMQYAAPNSPQWFNTGLHWAYGIGGNAAGGQWAVNWDELKSELDHRRGGVGVAPSWENPPLFQPTNAYERPQPHACFIQSVNDDLCGPGGINDLWSKEALLFKYGSGTGSNFSNLRAKNEPLSGGGRASGLMSFLEVGDANAKSIKSGGTTRRAAKMVVVDMDHPEIEEFIDWKPREEMKAAAMFVGSTIMKQSVGDDLVPQAIQDRVNEGFPVDVFGIGWEGEAYRTVSGQNSNNSARIPNAFLQKVDTNSQWPLTRRTDGKVVRLVNARDLFTRLCRAAWACGDPGVQFSNTINEWHTCAADGPINASNPCSEYLFIDETACNLASLNLLAFRRLDNTIALDLYEHAIRLWTMILDISVSMASFPSREIALRSYQYRTTGLGYANLGGLLMTSAIPYDSDQGRALCAGLTALLTGVSYRTSAEIAEALGPFPRWQANAEGMKRVLRNHERALIEGSEDYENLSVIPPSYATEMRKYWPDLWVDARCAWEAVRDAKAFRNAQVTNIAPTGTISFVMDCDTTGIEPELFLVKTKNLAGGGELRIVNQCVSSALVQLGYDKQHVDMALAHVEATGSIEGHEYIFAEHKAVFACGNELSAEAHIKMIAAAQPFLSGGISKTISLPNTATVADVGAAYRLAHKLGVKAVALYRAGSKMSEPLNAPRLEVKAEKDRPITLSVKRDVPTEQLRAHTHTHTQVLETSQPQPQAPQAITSGPFTLARGEREYLPWRRRGGYRQKVKLGDNGQPIYWQVSEFPDGRPGEIFIDLANEGTAMRAMANMVSIAISVGLQFGVPLAEYVDKFVHTRFEPAGMVEGHEHIKLASSLMDLIGRDLAIEYMQREDLANSPRLVAAESPPSPEPIATKVITGDPCPRCYSMLETSGTCKRCPNCFYDTGCG